MKIKIILLLTLLFQPQAMAKVHVWSEDIKETSIGLEKDYIKSDKRLNLIYNEAKSVMSKDNFSKLRNVQKSWVNYKEDACNYRRFFGEDVYEYELDYSAKLSINLCKLIITESRIVELEYLLSKNLEVAYYIFWASGRNIVNPNSSDFWNDYSRLSCDFSSSYVDENRDDCIRRHLYYYYELNL
ncbi:lysozyme inhibitor LprI family protein [Photobacterium sp. 1_MG-2023]|uniref:lysozyme inhibitor LprI family protein n=1 Tax=Photobacterium sp. 1_MG-2023 TaxID=3062646 RepID=UPI0026E33D5A|nr:lysozyme inhibitor LprI family protein [Photobacterium sp. 1_MG-2023]MDO6709009.1 lysozyme inhibitor LprI family protein [Photobacterium sp. 1_MG-2023]